MSENAAAAEMKTILTYEVNGVVYAVDIMDVVDIIELGKIIKVPKLPPFIKGLIDLRGQILPVVDVRLRFSLPQIEYDKKACIIVCNINAAQVGIIVERVLEVENISPSMIEPSRRTAGFVSEIITTENRVILVPDYEKLVG